MLRIQQISLSVLVSLVLGCSAAPFAATLSERDAISCGNFQVIRNIEVPAPTGPNSCGAQALSAALHQHDNTLNVDAMCNGFGWDQSGCSAPEILIAARELGFEVQLASGDWTTVSAGVSGGQTILVLFDVTPTVNPFVAGLPFASASPPKAYHWGLISGASRDGKDLLLAAPHSSHSLIHRDDFLTRWAETKCCMIIVGGRSAQERS